MAKFEYEDLIKRCDQLAQGKKPLFVNIDCDFDSDTQSIYFTGNKKKLKATEIDFQIFGLIMARLFEAPFSENDYKVGGVLTYDKQTKTFEGKLMYFKPEEHNRNCDIKISVPKRLWFDKLLLDVDTAESDSKVMRCELFIKNGVRPQEYDFHEQDIAQDAFIKVMSLTDQIEHVHNVRLSASILRESFIEVGKNLVSVVNQFTYTASTVTNRSVLFNLR